MASLRLPWGVGQFEDVVTADAMVDGTRNLEIPKGGIAVEWVHFCLLFI